MTDDIDQRLINALMADSRLSLKALAQVSGLSAPSVAERLRKLEERGVIRGYTLDIDPRCFGYQFQAIVRIRPLPGKLHEVERQIQDIAEFTECDKVTGDDCFIARLQVRSMEQLDTLLDRINGYAETNTAIVKKSPVKRRLPDDLSEAFQMPISEPVPSRNCNWSRSSRNTSPPCNAGSPRKRSWCNGPAPPCGIR